MLGLEQGPSGTNLWRRIRPGSDDRHTVFFFWLTVLGLGFVPPLSVTGGAFRISAQKRWEKLLRVEHLFPKLNTTQGERKAGAFRMSKPEPSDLAHPKERTTPPPTQGAVIDQANGALESSPHAHGPGLMPPVETCHDPVIYIPQRGDSPMIHNWKTLTMYALLSAAAVTFMPLPAVVFAEEKAKKVKDLEELQQSINDLVKRIDLLEKKKTPALDQDELSRVIRSEIRAEIKNVQDAVRDQIEDKLRIQSQKAHIDRLTEEVASLRKKLPADGGTAPAVDKAFMDETRSSLKVINETLAKLAPTEKRLMMSPPINGTAVNMGRVMLVNYYSDELLFIVNGVGHRVPAQTTRVVENIPVGTVAVEVFSTRFGIFSRRATTLAGGETFTLTANPPR
jgi:hypothetical protein